MRTKLHRQVLETIRQYRMIRPGDRVGVAVSGGADSVALLRLLEDLRGELGIRLVVLHFNHQLRGADSEADEHLVAELASSHDLELLSTREDVAAQARLHRWNLEDAARRLRYDFFSSLVEAGRITRVAVGHTADDQAETVLARLLRGTGSLGLAGIYPVVGDVVRPLLGVRRQELRGYLAGLGQVWREDASNLDTSRLRSRIRFLLLPQLERDFHGSIVAHLNALACLAREDEVFWTELIEDRFRALVAATPGELSIRVRDLLAPLVFGTADLVAADREGALAPLTKRLIRRIYQGLKGDRRGLTARHVEQVVHLTKESTSGHCVELPGGMVVERRFDQIVFRTHRPDKVLAGTGRGSVAKTAYEYVVVLAAEGEATVSIPEISRRFHLKVIDWPAAASDTRNWGEVLDVDLLRPPLVLRSWRPGDAYRPRGGMRVRKVKRLLLERRVAMRERVGWPVLTSAGRLVWVRGLPSAAEFAARPETRAGLVITEEGL